MVPASRTETFGEIQIRPRHNSPEIVNIVNSPLISFAGKKFFAVTFIGSIVWIAFFSYLMVWWANIAGATVEIPPEVNYLFIFYFLFFTIVGGI